MGLISKFCFAGSMWARLSVKCYLVHPLRASVFGYTMGDLVVADRGCQFGWRSGPGFCSLFSSALEHAHTSLL